MRSIGFCLAWSELEKRRKAMDLFVQRQLEVINGIPQKIYYECGATPTNCPYKISAVRDEQTGIFELFEMEQHSHPMRAAVSSAFLVDRSNPESIVNNAQLPPLPTSQTSADGKPSTTVHIQSPIVLAKKNNSLPCKTQPQKRKAQSPEKTSNLPKKKITKATTSEIAKESVRSELASPSTGASEVQKQTDKTCVRRTRSRCSIPSRNVSKQTNAPLTRSKAKSLLENYKNYVGAKKFGPSASRIKVSANMHEEKTEHVRKRVLSSSSSSPAASPEISSGCFSDLDLRERETDVAKKSADTLQEGGDRVWMRIVTLVGSVAFKKFCFDNQLSQCSTFIWRCMMKAHFKCPYRIMVKPESNSKSTVFHIFASGAHSLSCKRQKVALGKKNSRSSGNESSKNTTNLRKDKEANAGEDNKATEKDSGGTKRKSAILAEEKIHVQAQQEHREMSAVSIATESSRSSETPNESVLDIENDETAEEDESARQQTRKDCGTSLEANVRKAVADVLNERRTNSIPKEDNNNSNSTFSVDTSPSVCSNANDSVMIVDSPFVELNKTFPQLITSTPISFDETHSRNEDHDYSRQSQEKENNNEKNASTTDQILLPKNSSTPVLRSVTPIIAKPVLTLTPTSPLVKKLTACINGSDNSNESPLHQIEQPVHNSREVNVEQRPVLTRFLREDLHFSLDELSSQLGQMASELLLKFVKRRENMVLLSSKEQSLTGQFLVLIDKLEGDDYVKIMDYADSQLIAEECWQKASSRQFLYAIRGKCVEFFYEIPNDSVSADELDEANIAAEGTSEKNVLEPPAVIKSEADPSVET